jgi:hypothetical protein
LLKVITESLNPISSKLHVGSERLKLFKEPEKKGEQRWKKIARARAWAEPTQ